MFETYLNLLDTNKDALSGNEVTYLVETTTDEHTLEILAKAEKLEGGAREKILESSEVVILRFAQRGDLLTAEKVKLLLKYAEQSSLVAGQIVILLTQRKIDEKGLLEILASGNKGAIAAIGREVNGSGLTSSPKALETYLLTADLGESHAGPMETALRAAAGGYLNSVDIDAIMKRLIVEDHTWHLKVLLSHGRNEEKIWDAAVKHAEGNLSAQKLVAETWEEKTNITLNPDTGAKLHLWSGRPGPAPKTLDPTARSSLSIATKEEITANIVGLTDKMINLGANQGGGDDEALEKIWRALCENPNLGREWLDSEGIKMAARSDSLSAYAKIRAPEWLANPETLQGAIKAAWEMRTDKTYQDIGNDYGPHEELLDAVCEWLIKKLDPTSAAQKTLWIAMQEGSAGMGAEKHWWNGGNDAARSWPWATRIAVANKAPRATASGTWILKQLVEKQKANPGREQEILGVAETLLNSEDNLTGEIAKALDEIRSPRKTVARGMN